MIMYSQGGIVCPVQDQRMTLIGNGRLRNQCGTTFPTLPTRMARPMKVTPVFFMIITFIGDTEIAGNEALTTDRKISTNK